MPLSDLEIRKAKPDAKPYKLFDGERTASSKSIPPALSSEASADHAVGP